MDDIIRRKRTGISVKSVMIISLCVCVLLVAHVLMNQHGKSWNRNTDLQEPIVPNRQLGQVIHNVKSDDVTHTRRPKQRMVFLKTHKTGSTTMASIIERFGYYRNLTFAVGLSHVLSFHYKFDRGNVFRFPGMAEKPFDILTNHARYNRAEMDAVVPDATYITILRKPENQLESAFGYFEMPRSMGIATESNPLDTFMDDPMRYYKKHVYMWQLSRNGMLYDLGFEHEYDDDEDSIAKKIIELDIEFDLVLLTEYFDESLILMKNLLRWDFEDILYLPIGARSPSHRFELTDELRKKLRNWSHGDALLYEHFNKTFWKRVAEYGPTFQQDLEHFVGMRKEVYDACIDPGRMNKGDKREYRLTLKNHSEKCKQLLRGDTTYTSMIRMSMMYRFGMPVCFYIYAIAIASVIGICLCLCVKCCKSCSSSRRRSSDVSTKV